MFPLYFRKFFSCLLAVLLAFEWTCSDARAQALSRPAMDVSAPTATTLIRGLRLNPQDPLQISFIVDALDQAPHDPESLSGDQGSQQESLKLIRYFLTALTIPEKDLWVNLSPYEKDRITSSALAQTEMGCDLLEQDYQLKQLTASLLNPESDTGRKLWETAYEQFYASGILHLVSGQEPNANDQMQDAIQSFNKVWIMPDRADIFAQGDTVLVLDARLKVMMERDYFAEATGDAERVTGTEDVRYALPVTRYQDDVRKIMREVVIPEIEREVNHGETFANLRQIYHALILAKWFKENLRQSFIGHSYADRSLVKGIDGHSFQNIEKIYQQYLAAFQKGAEGYLKEEYDPATQQVSARKYVTGGFAVDDSFALNNRAMMVKDSISEFHVFGNLYDFHVSLRVVTKANPVLARLVMTAFFLLLANLAYTQVMGRDPEAPLEYENIDQITSQPSGIFLPDSLKLEPDIDGFTHTDDDVYNFRVYFENAPIDSLFGPAVFRENSRAYPTLFGYRQQINRMREVLAGGRYTAIGVETAQEYMDGYIPNWKSDSARLQLFYYHRLKQVANDGTAKNISNNFLLWFFGPDGYMFFTADTTLRHVNRFFGMDSKPLVKMFNPILQKHRSVAPDLTQAGQLKIQNGSPEHKLLNRLLMAYDRHQQATSKFYLPEDQVAAFLVEATAFPAQDFPELIKRKQRLGKILEENTDARDRFMALSILEASEYDNVYATVGQAHEEGVKKYVGEYRAQFAHLPPEDRVKAYQAERQKIEFAFLAAYPEFVVKDKAMLTARQKWTYVSGAFMIALSIALLGAVASQWTNQWYVTQVAMGIFLAGMSKVAGSFITQVIKSKPEDDFDLMRLLKGEGLEAERRTRLMRWFWTGGLVVGIIKYSMAFPGFERLGLEKITRAMIEALFLTPFMTTPFQAIGRDIYVEDKSEFSVFERLVRGSTVQTYYEAAFLLPYSAPSFFILFWKDVGRKFAQRLNRYFQNELKTLMTRTKFAFSMILSLIFFGITSYWGWQWFPHNYVPYGAVQSIVWSVILIYTLDDWEKGLWPGFRPAAEWVSRTLSRKTDDNAMMAKDKKGDEVREELHFVRSDDKGQHIHARFNTKSQTTHVSFFRGLRLIFTVLTLGFFDIEKDSDKLPPGNDQAMLDDGTVTEKFIYKGFHWETTYDPASGISMVTVSGDGGLGVQYGFIRGKVRLMDSQLVLEPSFEQDASGTGEILPQDISQQTADGLSVGAYYRDGQTFIGVYADHHLVERGPLALKQKRGDLRKNFKGVEGQTALYRFVFEDFTGTPPDFDWGNAVLLTSEASGFVPAAGDGDAAMVASAPDRKGGIDLDSRTMDWNVSGAGIDAGMMSQKDLKNMDGLIPVITGVTPIASVEMLFNRP